MLASVKIINFKAWGEFSFVWGIPDRDLKLRIKTKIYK